MTPLFVVLVVSLSTWSQDDPTQVPDDLVGLSATQYRLRFEASFDAVDGDTVRDLVELNPNHHVDLFNRYVLAWITQTGTSDRSVELEKAAALAEAVAMVFDAYGLQDVLDTVRTWDTPERDRLREARLRSNEAMSLGARFEYAEAIPPARSAYQTFTELGWLAGVGEAGYTLGVCHNRLGKYDEAIPLFQAATEASEAIANHRFMAEILDKLSFSELSLGRPEQALVRLERSCEIMERLGNSFERAGALGSLGQCLSQLGRHDEALEHFRRALEFAEESGNLEQLATILRQVSDVHRVQDRFEPAIESLNRSISIYDELGHNLSLSGALSAVGGIQQRLGRYREAIASYRRALALAEDSSVPGSIVSALLGLADCYRGVGAPSDAILFVERAIDLIDQVQESYLRSAILSTAGNSYFSLRDYPRALEYYLRAHEIDRHGGNPRTIASSLANLGEIFNRLRDFPQAVDYLDRAMAIDEDDGGARSLGFIHHELGIAHDGLKDLERAIGHFEKALEFREAVGNSLSLSYTLNSLGFCHIKLGQPEMALRYLQKALSLKEKSRRYQDVARTRINLGRCCSMLGDPARAFQEYVAACRDLERVDMRGFLDSTRTSFRDRWGLPALLSGAARHLGDAEVEEAFLLIETLRGKGLLEGVQEKAATVSRGANTELDLGREALREDLRFAQAELFRSRQASPVETERIDALQDEILRAQEELDRLNLRLRLSNPKLAELHSPTPASLQEMRDRVITPDTVLLRYVLNTSPNFGCYVWVVTNSNVEILQLDDQEKIAEQVSALLEAISDPSRRDLAFVEPARRLFEMVVEPATSFMTGRRQILVVPDGVLGLIPFEVLLSTDPTEDQAERLSQLPYLLRDKTVRYAPSASFPVYLARAGTPREETRTHDKDFLLVGDPIHTRDGFSRIEKTRDEVLDIARRLVGETETHALLALARPGRSAAVEAARFDLLLGKEASKDRIRGDLTAYRILHFAVHGTYNAEHPLLSGLLLSESGSSSFLDPVDIARLQLDADLTFLSACDTAKGEVSRSEGVLNTARCFLLAGSRSVVMTHWQVMERVAPVVSEEFYDRFLDGVPAAEALRQAKLALIHEHDVGRGVTANNAPADHESPRWAHPSVWAPFVLYGGGQ